MLTMGTFIATIIAYNLLSPHLDNSTRSRPIILSILLILVASGIGTLNEIIDFLAWVDFDVAKQVGYDLNNACDLGLIF